MKGDENAVASEMDVGLQVPVSERYCDLECRERVLGRLTRTTPVGEHDRSRLEKERVHVSLKDPSFTHEKCTANPQTIQKRQACLPTDRTGARGTSVQTQPGTGAAVVVWLDGRWPVDLWGGAADASGGHAWGRESIVQPYSVTKPFVAVCALRLVERGELELDAVAQRYWPEFTARATVRQLLAHQAGVVALDAPAATDLFYDWDAMCSRLAALVRTAASGRSKLGR
jgi:CubicO group peptidase (beta-lactamase class C family)